MPKFSARSKQHLMSCDHRLQKIFKEVIKHIDCTILEGHREQPAQDEAFRLGRSQVKWPNGKHNKLPSLAIDAAMYPIDWNDTNAHYFFGGYVIGVANQLGYRLRWGGDWDMDTEFNDQTFFDLVHFELEAEEERA